MSRMLLTLALGVMLHRVPKNQDAGQCFLPTLHVRPSGEHPVPLHATPLALDEALSVFLLPGTV